jgi:molybdate transport system substrate-binding protein
MLWLFLLLTFGAAPPERGRLPLQDVRPATITVSAAISLTDVLNEIAAAYAKADGGAVRFNFAGSNVLARQIVNGAPADLFISADAAQMDLVEQAGAIAAGSRVVLVGNRLAIVATEERVAVVRSRFQDAPAEIRRLAIGDPAAVPAGRYAKAYLQRRGLWGAYEPRIVPTSNVRAALAAVENGAADAAIVYATDIQASSRAALAFVVAPDQGPSIGYPAAVIRTSRHRRDAERFLEFLRGVEAARIFTRHGFLTDAG